MNNTYAIVAKGLTKQFSKNGKPAVNALDLAIPKGKIYGFLGPNGCGKSTTIRMLTGLLEPTEGSVQIFDAPLKGNEESIKKRIGYMTQKFSLYENLTVSENLHFVADIYGLKHRQAKDRIDELVQLYGLEGLEKRLSGSMSGGQKQRLALACATLHKPELLFLDEPTSAVDPENRRDFWERLFDLCEQGTTILVSTHYMDEAERCHYLAILENGIKRADGAPDKLMAEMDASVIEVGGENLRSLKQQLIKDEHIISAAQVGTRLRVLVKKQIDNPLDLLTHYCPDHELNVARPSLEDVFVASTGGHHVG